MNLRRLISNSPYLPVHYKAYENKVSSLQSPGRYDEFFWDPRNNLVNTRNENGVG